MKFQKLLVLVLELHRNLKFIFKNSKVNNISIVVEDVQSQREKNIIHRKLIRFKIDQSVAYINLS